MEEIVFNKVFKNQYLRFKITTFLKTNRYESFTYDELTSCEWMIMNGYLELLKLKISRCDRLSFNCDSGKKMPRTIGRCKYDNGNTMGIENKSKQILKSIIYYQHSIFSIETSGSENEITFFNSLFKNYDYYFKLYSNYSNTIQTVLDMAIEYDNLSIIKLLIQQFNWVPTIDTFIHSFDIGSFKIVDYLLPYFKNQIYNDKEINELLWIRSIKFTNSESEFKLIESRVNWLVSIGLPRINSEDNKIIQDILLQLFDINMINSKIYQLLFLSKLVNLFNFQTYITNAPKFGKFKSSRGYPDKLVLELLDEKVEMLTNDQLDAIGKSVSDDQLKVYQFKNGEEDVRSLYLMLFKFTNPNGRSLNGMGGNLYSNYIYYRIKYTNTLLEYRNNYYVLFDNDYSTITEIKENYSAHHTILKSSGVFEQDKQLEYQYFSNLIDVLNQSVKTTSFTRELYLHAIQSDNYRLVDLLCSKLPAYYPEFVHPSPYIFMKSTEIFDRIYKEDTVKNQVLLEILYNNELATHFKLNSNDFKLSVVTIHESQIHSVYKPCWSKYIFIFNNWFIFSTNVQIKLMSTIWDTIQFNEMELQEFINFFNSSINVDCSLTISNIKIFEKNGCNPNKTTFEQLNWLSKQQDKYNFKLDDLKSISNSILYYFNYLTGSGVGGCGDINETPVDKLNFTIYEIAKRCDLSSFNQLLSSSQFSYNNSESRSSLIETCLKYSITFNNYIKFLNNLDNPDKMLILLNLEKFTKLNLINSDINIKVDILKYLK